MSVLIATLWLPLVLARHPDLAKAYKLLQKRFLIFCVIYVIAVLYVMPRL